MKEEKDKLVFESVRLKNAVIARPVRTLVVAIPRLEEKYIDNCPTEQGNVAFLVLIVTWFHGAGGLPHHLSGLVRNDSVF